MAVDTFTGVIVLQTTQAIQMSASAQSHVDPLDETHLRGAIIWVGGDGIMAAIMMIVAATWLQRPNYRKRNSRSWLEACRANLESHQSRGANLPAPVSSSPRTVRRTPVQDVDTDDQTLNDYNAWLQRIARTNHESPQLQRHITVRSAAPQIATHGGHGYQRAGNAVDAKPTVETMLHRSHRRGIPRSQILLATHVLPPYLVRACLLTTPYATAPDIRRSTRWYCFSSSRFCEPTPCPRTISPRSGRISRWPGQRPR